MPFDPARLGIFGVHRVSPIHGDDIGDATAGGSNTVQQYMDARRKFLGNVADVAARNLLTGVVAGEWVFVESTGSGPRIDMWNGVIWESITGVGGGGAPAYSVVTVTTSPYTVLASNDVVVCNRATLGPFTVNLPATPANGDQVRVKDGKGDADTQFITITATGGKTIDGAATLILDESFGARTLVFGDTTAWRVV